MKLVISLLALFITVYFTIRTIKLISVDNSDTSNEEEIIKAEVKKSLTSKIIRNNIITIMTVLYFYSSFMKLKDWRNKK